LQTGSLRCWGDNAFGQLGLGHTHAIGDDELPTAQVATVALDQPPLQVASGGDHTCVILDGSKTRCWGRNDGCQLGIIGTDTIGDDEQPTAVPADDWSAWGHLGRISLGRTRSFVGFSDMSSAHGWGQNDDGGLGLRWVGNRPDVLPTTLGGYSFSVPTVGISAGGYHACVLLQNHDFRCWGINAAGQLGLPSTMNLGGTRLITDVPPVDFGLDANGFAAYPVLVATGGRHSCVLLNTGALKCWGENSAGQLGLGYASLPPTSFVGGDARSVPAVLAPVEIFVPSPP
jgi:alpha-tubulin suppressor-like RCC1 family protein